MLLAAIAFAALAAASELIVLTDDNFRDVLAERKVLFVKMFAPWCGHCKALAPTWEEMANEVNKPGADYFVAECDCVGACKSTCNANGVRGFPTIKMFTAEGGVYDFDGGRSKPELMVWADAMLKPALVEYATLEAAKEAAQAKGQPVHFVFTGKKITPEMNEVADKYKGKLLFSFVPGEKETLVAHREGDAIEMPDKLSASVAARFVEQHRNEYLPRLGNNNFGALASIPGRTVAFVAIDPARHQLVHDLFRKLVRAQTLAPQAEYEKIFRRYTLTDLDGIHWKQFLAEMDLAREDLPALVIYAKDSSFAARKLDPENVVDSAIAFLNEHIENKVELIPFDKEKREAAKKEKEAKKTEL